MTSKALMELLPRPPEDFVGREVDMYRTLSQLTVRRMVTVIGPDGCGKSALAAALCQYLAARSFFPDAILHVRMRNKSGLDQLLSQLVHAIEAQHAKFTALSNAAADSNIVDPLNLKSMEPERLPPKPASGDVESLSEWV
eukprot:CAMPEP_0182529260 /NCGR_PEP_ID=MMETSP1323-20130603/5059_1 /TAXON_ID=236787 /ORGANISM="Florenciella parvula, Strain RCC1693" /LENGTH=139 /DNA_ID=CAMNT_0024738451 /DNA_START=48 /DNA_END=463 /DNA_ORIENTATION=+